MRTYLTPAAAAMLFVLVRTLPAAGAPITVTDPVYFRDEYSANDVNLAPGDRVTFGASSVVPNGSAGTTGSAQQGATTVPLFFEPFDVLPNAFLRTPAYNPSLTGAWTLTFSNGSDTAIASTPAIGGTAAQPFIANMTISGSGATPTFSWTVPPGTSLDAVSIRIWDLQNRVGSGGVDGTGVANIIHADSVAPGVTSYTLPSVLSAGGTLVNGHQYAVSVQIDKFRDPAGTDALANVISRSRSFFDFSPLGAGAPPNVFLPVSKNSSGGYVFNITVVGGKTVFVDPFVATGYDFLTAPGNPNFVSVLLPAVGDNLFDVLNCNGDSLGTAQAGVAFSFGGGGLNCFRVRGIETSAGLDPNNVTAFVTGLTFAADGTFSGTMTPITSALPEPTSLILMSAGFAGFVLAKFHRRRPRGMSRHV